MLRQVITALLSADLRWVAVALGLYLAAIIAGGLRWQVIVRALGGDIRTHYAVLATIATVFVNNVTPSGRLAGEACRIAITRLKGSITLPLGAVASLGDRLSDLPALAVLGFVSLPVLQPLVGGHLRTLIVAVALLAAVVAILGPRVRSALRSWVLTRQRELGGAPVSARRVALVVGLGMVIWIEDLLRLMAVAAALDVSLGLPQASALCVMMVVGGMVPTIGGLGAVEGGLVGAMLAFGIDLQTAIAITAVERAISYAFSTLAGGLAVAWLGGRQLLRFYDRAGSVTPGAGGVSQAVHAGDGTRRDAR